MACPHCSSARTYQRKTITKYGYNCYRCRNCAKFFNERTLTPFNRLRFSTTFVFKVVVWWLRYKLSRRDLAEMHLPEGITLSHETVREWEEKFAPTIEAELKDQRKGQAGKSWHTDETLIKVKKEWHYLYRAIDKKGRLVNSRLVRVRNLKNTSAFFTEAVAIVGHKPAKVTTDGEGSYPKAIRKVLGRKVLHRTNRYLNNRLEQDHRGIKGRTKPMLGFKSEVSAARFCPAYDEQRNYFRPRQFPKEAVSLAKRWADFKGKFLRLKQRFLQTKLAWRQSLLPI